MNRETDSVTEFTIAEQESPSLIAEQQGSSLIDKSEATDAPYGPNTTPLEVSSTNTQPDTYQEASTQSLISRRVFLAAALGTAITAIAGTIDHSQKAAAQSKPKAETPRSFDRLPSLEPTTFLNYELIGFVMTGTDRGFGVIGPSLNVKYITEISLSLQEGFKAIATHQIGYEPWAMAGSETNKNIKVLGGYPDLTLFKADGSRLDLKTNYTTRAIQIEPGDKSAIIYGDKNQRLDLNTGQLTDLITNNLGSRIVGNTTKIYTSETGAKYSYALIDKKLTRINHDEDKITIQDLVNPSNVRFDVIKSFSLNGKTVVWLSGNDNMIHQFIDGVWNLSFGPDKSKYPGYYAVAATGYAMNPTTNKAYLVGGAVYPDGSVRSNVEEIEASNPQDLTKRKFIAPESIPSNGIATGINVLRLGDLQQLIVGFRPAYNISVPESNPEGIYRVVNNVWKLEPITIVTNPTVPSKTLSLPSVRF